MHGLDRYRLCEFIAKTAQARDGVVNHFAGDRSQRLMNKPTFEE